MKLKQNASASSTLVSILSISFPTGYPQRSSIDELDSFIPAITFPSYSYSEINLITSNAENFTEFKDILNGLHFYFPFVPSILQLIADYHISDSTLIDENKDIVDTSFDETIDFCACVVMCSYISWRLFVEYTKNFEHLPLIFNTIPLITKSTYSSIIANMYHDILHFYLSESPSFSFQMIYSSLSQLFEEGASDFFEACQSLFLPILNNFIIQIHEKFSIDCEIFIAFLANLTDWFPDIIDNENSTEIINHLSYHIGQIETSPLHLFANLSSKIPEENSISICSSLPMAYYEYLDPQTLSYSIDDLKIEPKIKLPEVNFLLFNESNIEFDDMESSIDNIIESTFVKNKYTKRPFIIFERKYPSGYLFNEDIRQKLQYIADAAQPNKKSINMILKCFNSFITQSNSKFNNDIFYSFTVIISNLELDEKQANSYWNTLFETELFKSNYSSFDIENRNLVIDQIRSESIDSMIKSKFLGILTLFEKTENNPILFAEFIHRIFPHLQKIDHSILKSKEFIVKICQLSLFFQKMNSSANNIENKQNENENADDLIKRNDQITKIIESTRICLFQFLSHSLSIKEVANAWFSLPIFNNLLSSLIYEVHINEFVTEQYSFYFQNFFTNSNSIDNSFIKSFKNIFDSMHSKYCELSNNDNSGFVIGDKLPESQNSDELVIKIAINFMKLVSNILPYIQKDLKLMQELFDSITFSLVNLPFLDISHLYFIHVLRSFSFIKLNDIQYSVLSETFQKLNNSKYSSQIKSELYNLSSGIPNPNPIFAIQQPKILYILLENCKTDDELLFTINSNIYPIIKNSLYNCYQAFGGKVDVYLINTLINMKNDNIQKIELIKIIINVLTSIHSVKSSLDTAMKILELIGPIDSKHISVFTPYYIQALTLIFKTVSKSPEAYFPLSRKLEIYNVNSSIFHQSFEIAFWCNIEPYITNNTFNDTAASILSSENESIQVCFISDSKGKGINISFTSDSIVLRSIQKHENRMEFKVDFPRGIWHLVSIKFIIKEEKNQRYVTIHAHVDGNEVEQYYDSLNFNSNNLLNQYNIFKFRQFSENSVFMTIGSNEDFAPPGYISHCAIFPYNPNGFHLFSNHQFVSSDEPLFIVDFYNKNGTILPNCINEAKITTANSGALGVPCPLSYIFINHAKAHSLLLLFVEFDFLTNEGTKIQSLSDLTVEMIITFLQCSRIAQISFHEYHCIDSIVHLLSICHPSNLNFSIYLHISAMLLSIEVPELRQDFLTKIVLNFDIWGRTDSETLHLVTQHWHQNLFIEYKELIKSSLSIAFLLYKLKDYFDNENVSQNLTQLILKISNYCFTSNDFLIMIGFCISTTNFKLTNLYLDIIKKTLELRNPNDTIVSNKGHYIALLHNLLGFNDENILYSLIEIIVTCHRKNMICSLTLMQHLDIIMGQINSKLSTISVLHRILVRANTDTPELYPLCCLIALNCGVEAVDSLARATVPSTFFGDSPECLMWVIIIFCNTDVEARQKLFQFLFNDVYAKIKETCSIMQIICMVSNQSPDRHLISFLSLGFSCISDHPERFPKGFSHKMLKIAYNALLFRTHASVSKWIYKMIQNSPFSTEIDPNDKKLIENFDEQIDSLIFCRPRRLYHKIGEFAKTGINLQFSPRIDENGAWIDASLALQCLNMFEINFSNSLLVYDIILCALMFKVRPNAARTHLKRIKINHCIQKIPTNLLSFLFICGEKSDLSFISSYSPKTSPNRSFNAFNSLEDFSNQTLGNDLVKIASNIVSLSDDNYKIERNFTTLINHGVLEMCVGSIEEIKEKCKLQRRIQLDVWKQMWHEMTHNKGRWCHAKIAAHVKKHWKRSSSLCYSNNCPVKMLLNDQKYTDHIEASFMRDCGSASEAKTKIEEYRNNQKSYGIVLSSLRPENYIEKEEKFPTKIRRNSNFNSSINSANISPTPSNGTSSVIGTNLSVFKHVTTLIKPNGSLVCEFEINSSEIIVNNKNISFPDIKEILLRRRFHNQTAFEIFLKNGRSYFVNFDDMKLSKVTKHLLPFISTRNINDTTEKWRHGKISNFEYLMELNKVSGRSFNDISQYPIMPWIIADYNSETLDLQNPNSFRDLSKPMGAQNKQRLDQLMKNSINTGEMVPIHLYPNCYLSPMIILSYLVRVEPFTTLHTQYHGGAFEHQSKIFKSIPLAYKNATTLMSDFRELIPEFFTSHEFLINSEKFDLRSQKGGNVILPKWAKSAIHFVYLNRKALESDFASQNLHNWIDLIWGYKQTGEEAVKANNTFYPFMYSNVWENNSSFKLPPQQIETILSEIGQIPIQVFTSPHPKRIFSFSKAKTSTLNSPVIFKTVEVQFAHSSFAFGKVINHSHQKTNSNNSSNKVISNNTKGIALTTNGKLIYMALKGTFVSTISVDSVDTSYFGNFEVSGLGVSGFGDILTPTSFICVVGNGKSFILYQPIEKNSFASGTLNYTISHCCHDQDLIVTAGQSFTSVWSFRDLNKPLFTIPTYRESISCVQISINFDLIVVGTSDGFLQFNSIFKEKSMKIVDLNGFNPLLIKISPAWGFVLVYAVSNLNGKRCFQLFSANGSRLKQLELNDNLTSIEVYKNVDGFDYAVIGTESGYLFHFEVFYLNVEKTLFKSQFPIRSISYVPEQNMFYCSGKSNTIIGIPVPV
ncbi:hypothetical protein TRFO_25336 [Tritrichomonas foetus]|uniref:BEACH domain-containing protein n=1 Tax=Tritrichomonas foetus TaxID=1144522 RepID=A0A1J4K5C2_9EUKA|nr:hypothetical protein TRFO_25336 [Tritrichomonas foetus]|eukprot:OHT06591.1 hypothetical protein TRFO_25336 [Tritrichomonas foetus]